MSIYWLHKDFNIVADLQMFRVRQMFGVRHLKMILNMNKCHDTILRSSSHVDGKMTFVWLLATSLRAQFSTTLLFTVTHNSLDLIIITTGCANKKQSPWRLIITSANVNRFSKFFHHVIRKRILYVRITKISTSPAVCCYTTLWKSKILKCYPIFTLNVTVNMFNKNLM